MALSISYLNTEHTPRTIDETVSGALIYSLSLLDPSLSTMSPSPLKGFFMGDLAGFCGEISRLA